MTEGAGREEERSQGGPTLQAGAAHGLAAPLWVWGPTALSPPFLRVLLRPENLSHERTSRRVTAAGAENTREKSSRRAGIRRGNSLPEGEIDAIAIVIERDIISIIIIIIIISTIYIAITIAAPRHRRNNSVCEYFKSTHGFVPGYSNGQTMKMEPYVQTETYDLENGGSLVFERDLYLVSEKLERPPPQFHGVRIHNTPAGEQQWMITADLKGSSEPPISERILFSFKAYSWVDGLAHALQEGLARVCGQNIAALRGSRFAHFARHDTMGEPMALSSHPVLKIHVQHLDFMLHETRKDLELTRVHSHRAQMALAHHADAIRLLAKDRRSLRLQRAKNVATITRLREKIHTLEVTVRTQQDQIQEMEEDGEDIQGGNDFLSDDNDFEDDEFTDEEDYEFLEAAEDGIIPIDVDEDHEE
ncbi:hypothetical protein QYE76_022741 [Lolium multiflorum]|uniref:Uncharacterized protein n=1 Tax=Lolium multiflorum TaxID=4521 RepID=A0AAD8VS54_LOLMU|nr:hypothetical protein QYE76_022741 [Lolium multiflorum]